MKFYLTLVLASLMASATVNAYAVPNAELVKRGDFGGKFDDIFIDSGRGRDDREVFDNRDNVFDHRVYDRDGREIFIDSRGRVFDSNRVEIFDHDGRFYDASRREIFDDERIFREIFDNERRGGRDSIFDHQVFDRNGREIFVDRNGRVFDSNRVEIFGHDGRFYDSSRNEILVDERIFREIFGDSNRNDDIFDHRVYDRNGREIFVDRNGRVFDSNSRAEIFGHDGRFYDSSRNEILDDERIFREVFGGFDHDGGRFDDRRGSFGHSSFVADNSEAAEDEVEIEDVAEEESE
ncbi:hypothetical protein HDU97_009892 [Phlyctochytrium planicorne]|nr:hypothetical protein HDU97_009892 [Phlyctochytrium planicorne]